MTDDVVDLFDGAGGWTAGIAALGLRPIGLELWEPATRTTRAAGHDVIRADVAAYSPDVFDGYGGLIASPPCQTFSANGSKSGYGDLPALRSHILSCRHGWVDLPPMADPRTQLVLEPLRWALAIRPRWIALEQVPAVLPLWHAYGLALEAHGYAVWSGEVNAADYGVPQTRRRALLLASLDGTPSRPQRTHGGRSGPPYVTMADALPAKIRQGCVEVNTGRDWPKDGSGRAGAQTIPLSEPAPTVTGKSGGQWHWAPAADLAVKAMTVEDCAALQSFPAGYPWRGNLTDQFLQVGNAVPPLLAWAAVAEVASCARRVVRPRAVVSPSGDAEQGGLFG